jgi:hypothetical protein
MMEKKRFYHMGVYFPNYQNKTVAVVQLVTDKDCLNCETVEYFGRVLVTKKETEKTKEKIIEGLKKSNPIFKELKKLIIQ